MSSFGTQLKEIRKQKGLTQADLARELKIAQTTIANYEQGTRFPDEDMLNRLADFFRVSIDLLLGRESTEAISEAKAKDKRPEVIPPWMGNLILELTVGKDTSLRELIETHKSEGKKLSHIYDDILTPLMYETGRRWEAGTLDVYQEHVISEVVRRTMSELSKDLNQNADGPRFLGFTVSGELHELGLRAVCDLLQSNGWYSLYLGSNLPTRSIIASIEQFKPRVVGISASLSIHIPQVSTIIYRIRNEFSKNCPKIMVGGQGFGDGAVHFSDVLADAYARDSNDAVKIARQLISS